MADDTTSKETFENAQTASAEDVTSVLHYDPFKKGDEIPEGKTSGKADTSKSAGEGDATPSPAPAPAPSPAPAKKPDDAAKPGSDDQARHWREIAESRAEELKTLRKPADEPKTGPTIPEYNFTVPKELIQHLTSEKIEDFESGVVGLAKGIAGAVHAQMLNHMEQLYKPRFDGIPQQVIQMLRAHQTAKAVETDFYGKYPELNHPSLRSLVKQTAASLAKELGKEAWDETLRDKTAESVKALIAAATGAKPNGSDSNPPPRMLPAGGTRTPAKNDNSELRDIADTLFSGEF